MSRGPGGSWKPKPSLLHSSQSEGRAAQCVPVLHGASGPASMLLFYTAPWIASFVMLIKTELETVVACTAGSWSCTHTHTHWDGTGHGNCTRILFIQFLDSFSLPPSLSLTHTHSFTHAHSLSHSHFWLSFILSPFFPHPVFLLVFQ